ncbi:hypothetical protein GY45DRAFT_153805 [Cubamyces sp. BRFM 1775]|nr:hypothetical protein GY45DRAFT_153805 [Cubamyces sp. BRFM 1775]
MLCSRSYPHTYPCQCCISTAIDRGERTCAAQSSPSPLQIPNFACTTPWGRVASACAIERRFFLSAYSEHALCNQSCSTEIRGTSASQAGLGRACWWSEYRYRVGVLMLTVSLTPMTLSNSGKARPIATAEQYSTVGDTQALKTVPALNFEVHS